MWAGTERKKTAAGSTCRYSEREDRQNGGANKHRRPHGILLQWAATSPETAHKVTKQEAQAEQRQQLWSAWSESCMKTDQKR